MLIKLKKQIIIILVIVGLVMPFAAAGIVEAKIPGSKVPNIPQKTASEATVKKILNGVYQIAGVVAIIVIIISGLRMVTGGDNPDTVATARKAIIYACVGLVVIISAFVITQFVINIGST